MRFSERMGYKPVRLELQKDSMDSALRSSLWNALILTSLKQDREYDRQRIKKFAATLYIEFFKWTMDRVPSSSYDVVNVLKKWFFDASWSEVYDFIEHCILIEMKSDNYGREKARELISFTNQFLITELSAYRVVAGQIVPLTNDSEIQSVNETVERRGKFASASDHIQTAIRFYSDRTSPDYRNSVKESISAVESVVRLISGSDKSTLGDALKIVDKTHSLHSALKEGLLKIYGYTNDESGIRHSMIEESSVDRTDAYFMLISCSAFCNFLIERCGSEN
jgi:Arc/MetJ-type ribon-helix-helix transcriptional regulator